MNKSRCFLVDMYLCGHQLVGYIIYINIKSNNSTCPFLGGVLLTVIIHDRKSDWYQYCPSATGLNCVTSRRIVGLSLLLHAR